MSIMKIILQHSVDVPVKEENTWTLTYRQFDKTQEPALIASLDTYPQNTNHNKHSNPPPEYSHHRKQQTYRRRDREPSRSPNQSQQKANSSQYPDSSLRSPCSKCKEWGHRAQHCKGAGNNGMAGKKYAPLYCENCEMWAWHGKYNRYCPRNRSKDNGNRQEATQKNRE